MKTKWMALTVLSLGLCVQALAQGTGSGAGRTDDASRTPEAGTRSDGESPAGEDMSGGVQSSTSTDVHRSTSTDVFRSTGGARGSDPRTGTEPESGTGTDRQAP